MGNAKMAVKTLSTGCIVWVMEPEFEKILAFIIDLYSANSEVVDEVRVARRHGNRI